MPTNETDLTHGTATALIPKADLTLSINEAGEVSTVLHPPTGHIFVINTVARRIIELCDGTRNLNDISKSIAAEFDGTTPARVTEDLDRFLGKAFQKKLISWS